MTPSDDVLLDALRVRMGVEPRHPMWKGDVPKMHPRASPQSITVAEAKLGFRLPPLLRRIYEDIADGGFGPAYGLFAIEGRHKRGEQGETVVEVRDKLAVDPRWPHQLLPLCDWGCANWSCLDCRSENGSIVTLASEQGFFDTGRDLRSWLSAWLSGIDLWEEMFGSHTTMGINPFTRQPIAIKGRGEPRGKRWFG
jgi:hypothetical protein